MNKYKIDVRVTGREDGTPFISSTIICADTPEEAKEVFYDQHGDWYIILIEEVEE